MSENIIKYGSFEWVINDFNLIQQYFDVKYTGINFNDIQTNVLDIGCGTSTLCHHICETYDLCNVIGIDNDIGCISHMKNILGNTNRLKFYHYDLIEDDEKIQNNELDICNYFDMIIDKGTFDAILVEGVTCTLLKQIHRLLRVNGIYLLISINSKELLQSLLSNKALSFMANIYYDDKNKCTIAICKKVHDIIDVKQLAIDEINILQHYFQSDHPLLTIELQQKLNNEFKSKSKNGYLTLIEAHDLVFIQNNKDLEYTYELFLDDIDSISLSYENMINFNEVMIFLQSMQ